jgi:cyclopropane-fatty-acyl-phospholipid synthase
LYTTDIEILRLHYARTLADWRKRFAARRDEAVALYDKRFARMWEFYLASSELSFRHLGLNNFQLQATRHLQALPITRDYMAREEARLKRAEQSRKPIPGRHRQPPRPNRRDSGIIHN